MKKLFLDTNILLDYYLNRSGADAVEKIFILSNAKKLVLFASTLTFANFAYVIKREHSKEELYAILAQGDRPPVQLGIADNAETDSCQTGELADATSKLFSFTQDVFLPFSAI